MTRKEADARISSARTVWCDLKSAKKCEVNLATSDHREALRGAKGRGSLTHRDGLFACIDKVRVDLALLRIGPDTE